MQTNNKYIFLNMETEKKAGVKKGTKRGPYKKTINKLQNEENINLPIEQKIDNVIDGGQQQITEPIQQEIVNEVVIDTVDRAEIPQPDISSGDKKRNNEFTETTGPQQSTEKSAFQHTTGEEKLDSFFNEYKDTTEQPNKETTTNTSTPTFQHNQQMKMLINGYMLLSLCDVVFPYGIKFLFGLFNPKAKKVNVNDMKLEPEQREALMNSADAVAQYVFEKANPMTVFVICLGLFYGTNFQAAMQNVKDDK